MSETFLFIISLILLILSGSWAINALDNFGRALRLSQFALGFVIMAFATNLPELFIGANAIIVDQVQLSFGDLIGSNLVNLGLILGIVFILSRDQKYRFTFKQDAVLNLLIVAFLFLFMSNGYLSRIEGFILLLFFGFRIYTLYQDRKEVSGFVNPTHKFSQIFWYFLTFVVFVGILIASSYFVVNFGINIAYTLGISSFIIGLVVIAFGTSLPELVFSVHATRRKKTTMAIGNLLGSALINFTLILGLIAIIKPISMNPENVWWSIICLMTIALFLLITEFRDIKNRLILGIFLISIYIVYILGEIDIINRLILK